ncbi:hypothetical protein RBSWK_00580 [Rhodopirellula baltica SWK14]|uniref:Uncharacterized protein n=1 Tax=Rhodopirellula baltica SWK14 TaxID=993516 RepID=L7CP87_RHOBT|nr:hypothetical protein RBSWK_00580 [Rhodopirellula baltica SWK14]
MRYDVRNNLEAAGVHAGTYEVNEINQLVAEAFPSRNTAIQTPGGIRTLNSPKDGCLTT